MNPRVMLMGLVLLAVILYILYRIIVAIMQRQTQRELARFAPEYLEFHNVPAPVARVMLEQHKQLKDGRELVQQLLTDQSVMIGPDYYYPLEQWVETTKPQLPNKPRRQRP